MSVDSQLSLETHTDICNWEDTDFLNEKEYHYAKAPVVELNGKTLPVDMDCTWGEGHKNGNCVVKVAAAGQTVTRTATGPLTAFTTVTLVSGASGPTGRSNAGKRAGIPSFASFGVLPFLVYVGFL